MSETESMTSGANFPIEHFLIQEEVNLLVKENKSMIVRTWLYAVFGSLSIILIIYFIFNIFNLPWIEMFYPLIPMIVSLPFYLPFKMNMSFAPIAEPLVMERIARLLRYSYEPKAPQNSVSGVAFSHGTNKYIKYVYIGVYNTYPTRIFSYYFSVPSGKSSTEYKDTVFEITYTKPLPHILIVPKSTFIKINEEIDLYVTRPMQKATLEGNFNDTFDILIEESAQIEVREILTPDVMQFLLSSYSTFIVELFGNKMYLVRRDTFANPTSRQFIDMLGKKLVDKLHDGLRSASKE